jgi:hypothetical protein
MPGPTRSDTRFEVHQSWMTTAAGTAAPGVIVAGGLAGVVFVLDLGLEADAELAAALELVEQRVGFRRIRQV